MHDKTTHQLLCLLPCPSLLLGLPLDLIVPIHIHIPDLALSLLLLVPLLLLDLSHRLDRPCHRGLRLCRQELLHPFDALNLGLDVDAVRTGIVSAVLVSRRSVGTTPIGHVVFRCRPPGSAGDFSHRLDTCTVLEGAKTGFELDAIGDAHFGSGGVRSRVGVRQSVDTDGKGSFGSDHTGHFTLEFLWCLTNERGLSLALPLGGSTCFEAPTW